MANPGFIPFDLLFAFGEMKVGLRAAAFGTLEWTSASFPFVSRIVGSGVLLNFSSDDVTTLVALFTMLVFTFSTSMPSKVRVLLLHPYRSRND